MNKRILAPALLACFLLSGCGGVLAESYQVSTPHIDRPVTAEDSTALRVENYQELVSAILYLVSQGQEEGTLQLYDYPDDVETALSDACLEVATQDPLGAYCVDYIRHEVKRVVSYDQATVTIHYRRTDEQVRSIVNVTGTSAIRTELREALAAFQKEVVLRVAYFSGDAASIEQLVRQAYLDEPVATLGYPKVEVNLYPETGSQRVVEILLSYDERTEVLRERSQALGQRAGSMSRVVWGMEPLAAAEALASALWMVSDYDAAGADTAYAALMEGHADDLGMTLGYLLLCRQAGLDAEPVEGCVLLAADADSAETEDGESQDPAEPQEATRWWVAVETEREETLYLDLTQRGTRFVDGQTMFEAGYRWEGCPQEESSVTDADAEPMPNAENGEAETEN